MQITIFYFSGTGNTEWVVKMTQEMLKGKNHQAEIYKIEELMDGENEIISKTIEFSDYIGFAFPMYGADIPRIMRKFIDRFIALSNSDSHSSPKLFIINTFGYVNGCGIFRARKLLRECRYPIHAYFNFRLPNNTSTKINRTMLGKNMPDSYKGKSTAKIEKLINSLAARKKTIQGIGPHLSMGIIIRRLLRDEVKTNYKNMSVNYSKCSKCMKCVKSCPTNSIEFADDKFTFKDTCETCWRCFTLCPTGSISMNKKSQKQI